MSENLSLDFDATETTASPTGPVTALGLTFENDQARRAHFIGLLQEKLQDPEFRKIEGFPIGADEDILALSDPPYYTACPNPWIADFIAEWEAQKPEQPKGYKYHSEPFAADISEGKGDRKYFIHTYHTKGEAPQDWNSSIVKFSNVQGVIKFVVWSDVVSCPECAHTSALWDLCVDLPRNASADVFECPNCRVRLAKERKHAKPNNAQLIEKVFETVHDQQLSF